MASSTFILTFASLSFKLHEWYISLVVMGHVLSNGLDLMGTGVSPRLDPKFKANIDSTMELADKTKLTQREEKHVNAMKKLADG